MEEVEDIENVLDRGTVERFGQRSSRKLVPERSTEYGGVEYGRGQMPRSVLNIVPGSFLMLTVVKVSNFFPPQSVGRRYKIT